MTKLCAILPRRIVQRQAVYGITTDGTMIRNITDSHFIADMSMVLDEKEKVVANKLTDLGHFENPDLPQYAKSYLSNARLNQNFYIGGTLTQHTDKKIIIISACPLFHYYQQRAL